MKIKNRKKAILLCSGLLCTLLAAVCVYAAVTNKTTVKINGITYKSGDHFIVNKTGHKWTNSDGSGGYLQNHPDVNAGAEYVFWSAEYTDGKLAKYPYLVNYSKFDSTSHRGYTDASVFPYAEMEVTFKANASGISDKTQIYTWGNASNCLASAFSREGYTQLGWAKSADASDPEYGLSEAVTDTLIEENQSGLILYAIWEKDKTVGFSTDSLTQDENMFTGCEKLQGGNGTVYSNGHTDSSYAKIDREGQEGYFTKK